MTKKEFIEKWSNWWMFHVNKELLTEAFENELNLLIEQENPILSKQPGGGQLEAMHKRF